MFRMNDKVYAALSINTDIKAACGDRIYHNGQPDGGIYPSLYYGEISNVPAMMADNVEKYTRLTMQVAILSDTGSYGTLPASIEAIMLGLGFIRVSYNDYTDSKDGKEVFGKSMRFIIGGVNQ